MALFFFLPSTVFGMAKGRSAAVLPFFSVLSAGLFVCDATRVATSLAVAAVFFSDAPLLGSPVIFSLFTCSRWRTLPFQQ